MKNFEILPKFPQEIIDGVKDYWHNHRKEEDIFRAYAEAILTRLDLTHELDHILAPLKDLDIVNYGYLIAPKDYGIAPPHIDRRDAALNLPIVVDTEKSFLYADKTRDVYDRLYCPEYEEEKFDHYNMESPVILNGRFSHGWANFSSERRVLFTMSFMTPYDEVVKTLPNEWF